MRILVVTADYPPEIRSVAAMSKELAEELSRRGHDVTVLTTWLRYNLPKGVATNEFRPEMQEGSVCVLRVKTLPLHKVGYFLRGLAQLTAPFLLLRAYKQYQCPAPDVVIMYSPPLPLYKVGQWFKQRHGARFLLNVQDIFPQNAIDLGIVRSRFLIWFLERMEQRAYQAADVITTCTARARQFLLEHKGVDPGKVHEVYNWVDLNSYNRARDTGVFRKRFELEGKWVLLFAGIMGPSQGIDFILSVAKQLTSIPGIHFLFVGDGTERPQLEQLATQWELNNVQFEDFVDPHQYPDLLREVDVGLVVLEKSCKTPTIPGKFFGYAAGKLPIMAFLNPESEGHDVIQQAHCGFTMISDDATVAAERIRTAYQQKEEFDELGKNGYDYVTAHFSKDVCITALETSVWFTSLV